MKRKFIIFLMLAAVSAELTVTGHDLPAPRGGILDLREMNLGNETLVILDGEWEFYLKHLLFPAVFVHMSEQKELEARVNAPPGMKFDADRPLVNTILRNLISNAIKFTPNGGNHRERFNYRERN